MHKIPSKKLTNLIFEIGDLKRIKRSGWWHCKVKDPESVAEHSFRASFIAFVLAKLENHPSPERIAFASLVHDLPESRLTDLHRIAQSYVKNKHQIELEISKDQQDAAGFNFPSLSKQEKLLVKDADLLEMAFTAKEYAQSGNKQAMVLFYAAKKGLKTRTSKALFSSLNSTDCADWWTRFTK